MHVFLPYANLSLCAHVLERTRLRVQYRTGVRLLQRLLIGGMSNRKELFVQHPGRRMWIGYERALLMHVQCCAREMVQRGLRPKHGMLTDPQELRELRLPEDILEYRYEEPDWAGMPRLHSSHRAALLASGDRWYRQWDWDEPPGLALFWPRPMPTPGRWVLGSDQVLRVVTEVREDEVICERDGYVVHVDPWCFRSGQWRLGRVV